VVAQLPVIGEISNPLLDFSLPRAEADEAELGWYKATLSNKVTVELAASRHSGVIRHTFPADASEKHILVDVSHFLPSSRGLGIEQNYVEGGIKLHKDGRYTGYGVVCLRLLALTLTNL
jgi:putative alpha-1,2-mannosidase